MIILLTIISVISFAFYLMDLKKNKFNIKTMAIISMISALSYILYIIQFIKYPQGGGISLFSMLPIMLLSILYGRTVGVTGGLLFGVLKLLNSAFIVHPIQFIIDYLLSTMVLGLACIFGIDKKYKIICGCLVAVSLSIVLNIISGVVFFAQYAPKGMNVWLYSFIYNFSTGGVEGILSIIILMILPIKRLEKVIVT